MYFIIFQIEFQMVFLNQTPPKYYLLSTPGTLDGWKSISDLREKEILQKWEGLWE